MATAAYIEEVFERAQLHTLVEKAANQTGGWVVNNCHHEENIRVAQRRTLLKISS